MIAFTSAVVIGKPTEIVFAVVTDFEQYLARWAKGPVAARKLTSGKISTGSRFGVTAKVGPYRPHSLYEVLAFQSPTDFVGKGTAGPVRFEEEYRFIDDGGSTHLEQSIRAWPRGPFRLVEGAIERKLRALIPADLERLRDLVSSLTADG